VVKRVPERLMRAFSAYAWPGNVRELENVVERALIMTSGETLAADPAFLEAAPVLPAVGPKATLAEAERAHIRAVLAECGGKISGKGNAADRLGLNRSTLQFKMKKPASHAGRGRDSPRARWTPASLSLAARLRFEALTDVAARFLNTCRGRGEPDHPGAARPAGCPRRGSLRYGSSPPNGGSPIAHNVARPGIPEQPLVDLAPLLPWSEQVRRAARSFGLDPEAFRPRPVRATWANREVRSVLRAAGETQEPVATFRSSGTGTLGSSPP
jgi:hypothetical protein